MGCSSYEQPYDLVPQVPSYITTLPTYDQNGELSQLNIQWSTEVRSFVVSLGEIIIVEARGFKIEFFAGLEHLY